LNKNVTINIFANFLGKIITMLSTYLFLPIYLKYLGGELYGVVSFYATLQSAMLILGMGLTSTLRKEFAVEGDSERKYKLLRAVEYIYFLVMFIIIGICFGFAGSVIIKYINLGNLNAGEIKFAIGLMGISIAFHLLSNLYSGCLLGVGKQVRANIWQTLWAIGRAGSAVLVIIYIDVNIILFFSAQIIVDIIYVIILRLDIYFYLKKNSFRKYRFKLGDFKIIQSIIPYTSGLLGISIISMLNTQLDKVLVLEKFDFATLGIYNTASTLAQIPNSIVTILMVAIYNELISSYASGDRERYARVYIEYYQKVYSFLISVVVFMGAFSVQILQVWTKNEQMALSAAAISGILLVGNMFLGMQQVPYYFLLAAGRTRYNNIMGVISCLINIVVTPIMVLKGGLFGAGMMYMLLRAAEFFCLTIIVQKKYIQEKYLNWMIINIVIPALLTVADCYIVYKLIYFCNFPIIIQVAVAIAMGAGAFGIHLWILQKTKYETKFMRRTVEI